MRKFILIASLVLISASAQAGQTRGLIVASADPQPSVSEQLKAAGELPKTEAKVQPQQPQPQQAQAQQAQAQQAQSKPQPKSDKPVVRQRESDEHKARRIAAEFGISW